MSLRRFGPHYYDDATGVSDEFFRAPVRLVRGRTADESRDRYVPQADELLDTLTGLAWRRCSLGQVWDGSTCTGSPVAQTWWAALAFANAEAQRTGLPWRVPNVKELVTIVDRGRPGPSIDPELFPNTPNLKYWTSTPSARDTGYVFCADFNGGNAHPTWITGIMFVRLVRYVRSQPR